MNFIANIYHHNKLVKQLQEYIYETHSAIEIHFYDGAISCCLSALLFLCKVVLLQFDDDDQVDVRVTLH